MKKHVILTFVYSLALVIFIAPPARAEERKEKVFIGQSFSIAEGESLDEVVAIGCSGVVRGQVGKLVLIGSNVELAPTARVSEKLVSFGGQTRIDQAAEIDGEDLRIGPPSHIGDWAPFAALAGWDAFDSAGYGAFSWLLSFLFGSLFILFAPVLHERSREFVNQRAGSAFGLGLIGYVGILPGALALVLTIIGILLIPFYVVGIVCVIGVGHYIAGSAVGHWLPLRMKSAYLRLAIGLAFIKLVGMIPFVGGLAVIVFTTMGVGGVLCSLTLWLRERRARPRREVEAHDSGLAPA